MNKVTINLLPNKVYPQIKRASSVVGDSLGHDLSVAYGRTYATDVPSYVKGLGPCVGIKVSTPTHYFVAHSAPEKDADNPIAGEFLARAIYNLRENSKIIDINSKPSVVLYGGVAYDSSNPISEKSCQLVNKLEEACFSEDIEPTIITGQYGDGLNSRIDSYLKSDYITLWGNLIDKIKLTQKASTEEIKKVLEELFEYVKIPNGTELKILEELPKSTRRLVNKP